MKQPRTYSIYVINMDKSKDRLYRMKKHLDNLKVQFKRIQAIDGSRLSRTELIQHCTPECKEFVPRGVIGCALSHKKVWEVVANNDDDYALVLEDDCRLIDDFEKHIDNCLSDLEKYDEKWDFLYGGCFGPYDGRISSPFHLMMKLFLPELSSPNDPKSLCKHIEVPVSPVGFHCYVLSKNGAKKMIEIHDKVSYHIDVVHLRKACEYKLRIYKSKIQFGKQWPSSNNSTLFNKLNVFAMYDIIFDTLVDKDGVSYSYYMNCPIIQVGGYIVNLYIVILCLFFMTSKKIAFSLLLSSLLFNMFVDELKL